MKTKASIALLIAYSLLFNVYLYKLSHEVMARSMQTKWCYGCYSLLLFGILAQLLFGIKDYIHQCVIFASLFVLGFTFLTVLANAFAMTPNPYIQLSCFNFGVITGLLFVLYSYIKNK